MAASSLQFVSGCMVSVGGWSWEEAQLAFHAQQSVPPGGGALIWEHGQEERP